jgi:hypothetical protein
MTIISSGNFLIAFIPGMRSVNAGEAAGTRESFRRRFAEIAEKYTFASR